MRRVALAASVLMLAGCAPSSGNVARSVAPCFRSPDLHLWAQLAPAIRRYFYFRKQAILHRDMEILWREYPALRRGYGIGKGINDERDWITFYPKFIDADVFPNVEGMRVKRDGPRVLVFLDGEELYLPHGYEPSGGQLLVTLTMVRERDRWTVVKTDEVTDAEYHEANGG